MTTWNHYYVDASKADDTANGLSWANAKKTIAGAIAQSVTDAVPAGEAVMVWCKFNQAYTANAAITHTGTNGVFFAIVSADPSNGDAWTPGAKEEVGASNSSFSINSGNTSGGFAGALKYIGMDLGTGSNNNSSCLMMVASNNNGGWIEFDSCTLRANSIATVAFVRFGSVSNASYRSPKIILKNTLLRVTGARTATPFVFGLCDFEGAGLTVQCDNATKPTYLFGQVSGVASQPRVAIRDSDLSGFNTSSGSPALIEATNVTTGTFVFQNIRLASGIATVLGTWPADGHGSITLRNVESGATFNTLEYRTRLGTLIETTTTYANAGYTFDGANVAWQVTTTTACNELNPFVLPPLYRWNSVTTAQTASVEIMRGNAVDLTNAEIWPEVSHPASASYPHFAIASGRKTDNYLSAAGADWANSAEAWTESVANDNEQTISVGFTAAAAGMLECRIHITKPSLTDFFVDPLLRVA